MNVVGCGSTRLIHLVGWVNTGGVCLGHLFHADVCVHGEKNEIQSIKKKRKSNPISKSPHDSVWLMNTRFPHPLLKLKIAKAQFICLSNGVKMSEKNVYFPCYLPFGMPHTWIRGQNTHANTENRSP